jgi:HD superfamily phosphodiesterase
MKTLERVFTEAKRRCLEEEAKLHGKPTDYLWRHVERVYHLCIKIGERERYMFTQNFLERFEKESKAEL